MKLITESLELSELKSMASNLFGDIVKAVVDVKRERIALDAELHSDLEAWLLEEGSHQSDLWGINFYPELEGESFIEYDSLINIRPSQGNRTRGVDDETTRRRIAEVVAKRIKR